MEDAITNSTVSEFGADTDGDQYLTFMLDGEEYGVEILRVEGIHGWDRATPIPNTAEHVLGVMNLRGAIIPIVDLRRLFRLESIPFGPTTVVIIIRVHQDGNERTVGIVVDAVSEVYRLTHDSIQPAPDLGTAVNSEFVKGLATVEEKMLILLDVDQLISDELHSDIESDSAVQGAVH